MPLEKMLRFAIYAGLFAVVFIPLVVANNFFFPFITGKGFAFRVIVEVVFALWVILALWNPLYRPRFVGILGAVGLFVATLLISVFLSENPEKSFWSNFERMEGWVLIAHLGAYFTVLVSMLRSEKLWRALFNTSLAASVLVGLYGLLQLSGVLTINQGGVRVDGTFGNATYLAVYMLFHAFIAMLALLKWQPGRAMQVFYGVALFLHVIMIFYAATRGTTLGLLGGLLLSGIIFVLFAKGRRGLRRAGLAAVVAVVLLAGSVFALRDVEFIQNHSVLGRFAHISSTEAETRFTVWNMAIKAGLERPIFGWGQESFNYVFAKHYKPSMYAQEPWFDRAHNAYLDWFVAGGFPALLLYLSFFAFALWYLWRRNSGFELSERALLTGLLAAYGFHNLFVFDNLMSYVMFFTVLGYITYRHNEKVSGDTDASPAPARIPHLRGDTARAVSAGLVVVALFGVMYTVNYPGMARASALVNALRPYPPELGLTENFSHFKRAVAYRGLGAQEANEQFIYFAAQLRSPQIGDRVSQAFKDNVAQSAIQNFNTEIARYPNDARTRLLFGQFLRRVGAFDEAAIHLNRAVELAPRKQDALFERAILDLDRGNGSASLEIFKETFELDPRYDLARIYYVVVLIQEGNRARADELLLERYDTLTPDNNLLLQAYIDTQMMDRAVALVEGRVEQNPESYQARIQLAAAYLETNRIQDAIAVLRAAAELEPERASDIEEYIRELEG